MSTTGRRIDRTGRKASTPAVLFDKVLQAFSNGDISFPDVQSDLQRLLSTGASAPELLDVLRRCDSIEPLPRSAHAELASLLSEAAARDAIANPDERESRRDPASAGAAEPEAASSERVASLEGLLDDRKTEYEALMHAYERARDAGSTAAARLGALTAELAAVRNTLEAQQHKTRDLDRALAESVAAEQAARQREDEARRQSDRMSAELRRAQESLAAHDSSLDELRRVVGEREQSLALLRTQQTALEGVPDLRESVSQIQAELNAARARSAALVQELADERSTWTQTLVDERSNWTQALADERNTVAQTRAAAAETHAELTQTQAAAAQVQAELAQARTEIAQYQSALLATQEALEATRIALQEARAGLESEQITLRETDTAWAEAVAAAEAARGLTAAARQRAERAEAELQALREAQIGAPVLLDQQLQLSRVRAAAVAAELTSAYSALEAERSKSRALERTLAGKIAAPEAAREPEAAADSSGEAAVFSVLEPSPASAFTDVERPPTREDRESVHAAAPVGLVGAAQSVRLRGNSPFGLRTNAWGRALAVVALAFALAALVWLVRHRAATQPAVGGASAGLPGALVRDCPECPAITVVPAGRFRQGAEPEDVAAPASEIPAHSVSIARALVVSTATVTVDEFRAFVTATRRDMRGCDTFDGRWHYRPESSFEKPGFAQSGSHPVTCVSWNDAKAYAAWVSNRAGHPYRLPSAAEWEYAARAGSGALQPWQTDGSKACAHANLADQRAARQYPGLGVFGCDDGYAHTAPVRSFKANAFGLHDMLGNVFQWTEDCWHADYTGAPDDGSARTFGDCSQREVRGGSWLTAAKLVRAGLRGHFAANYRASTLGFRLVRDES